MISAASTPRPDLAPPRGWLPHRGHIIEGAPLPPWLRRNAASGSASDRSGEVTDAQDSAYPTEAAALGRVLVVDDEALVRRTLALFLTKAGFLVAAAASGAEAFELLRAGDEFDLLVTDQSMPGMSGCELIGEARELCPGLPALLVSGYDMSGGTERLPDGVPLLRKPVERAAFLDQVRALLGLAGDEDEGRSGP